MRYSSVKTTSSESLDKVVCDICKANWSPTGYYGWSDDAFTTGASTVEVSASIGDSWGEDDNRVHYEIDVCPTCFMQKVKPYIESIGGSFREESR